MNLGTAKRSSEDKGKATALPPADDVFQDGVTPEGKFLVKGFQSKLAQVSKDDNPYEPMVLPNGMCIYPWDPEAAKNFLELDDHEDDNPGGHQSVYSSVLANVVDLNYWCRLLQKLAFLKDKECEVIACLRQDPTVSTEIDERMLGPIYNDKLRTPPMVYVIFLHCFGNSL